MKMTKNDREALKMIVRDGSVRDSAIAQKLKISKPAVSFIRRKLEREGIIRRYGVELDYAKLGIHVFAICMMHVTAKGWQSLRAKGEVARIFASPNIINISRIPRSSVTHIVRFGFRSMEELDRYMHALQSQSAEVVQIRDVFVFSEESVMKHSDEDLLLKVINERNEGK